MEAVRVLRTFDQVVKVGFGGSLTNLAKATKRELTAVSNWKQRYQKFPPRTHDVIQAHLSRRNLRADPRLFGFDPPPRSNGKTKT